MTNELKFLPDIAAAYIQLMKAHRKEVKVAFTFASVILLASFVLGREQLQLIFTCSSSPTRTFCHGKLSASKNTA